MASVDLKSVLETEETDCVARLERLAQHAAQLTAALESNTAEQDALKARSTAIRGEIDSVGVRP